MIFKHIFLLLTLCVMLSANKLSIGGSSTLFLFSSTVSSTVGAMNDNGLPMIYSSGTTNGLKKLCCKNPDNSIDIANASRRIKAKELKICKKNGFNDIVELYIGRNGIVFVQNNDNEEISLTREEIFLAIAKLVPNKDNKLIQNPYKYWNEINPALAKRKILIYGHIKTHGIRESFDAISVKHISSKSKKYSQIYKEAGYKKYNDLREDGVFVELDNDKEILEKTLHNQQAIGVLNYLYFSNHRDKIAGLKIDGVKPSVKNIQNASYALTKKLYMYYKKSTKEDNVFFKSYINAFLSDDTIGKNGILTEIGFVPLTNKELKKTRKIYQKDILLKNLSQ